MFFKLSPTPDKNFPYHDKINGLWFSRDSGWKEQHNGWIKGYIGNFCSVQKYDNQIKIQHDRWRSFPLWYDQQTHTLTNLDLIGKQIWADRTVTVTANDILTEHHPVTTESDFVFARRSIDDVISEITSGFHDACSQLSTESKLVFLSGGLDSMINAALSRGQHDIELIDHEYLERDYFVDRNLDKLRDNFWAYRQVHHWKDPKVLITGGCGDEYLLRGPRTVAIWSAWHDHDMIQYVKSNPQCYMSTYYLKNHKIFVEEWNRRHRLRETHATYQDLMYYLLDILVNDHQHWHLGNTLTMTPLGNIKLAAMTLCLPFDDIIDQMANGMINRTLIQRTWPELESLVSAYKNTDTKQNLTKLGSVRLTR
jgi:hypothetical protein